MAFILAALAASAFTPVPAIQFTHPSLKTATNFRLVANVTSGDLDPSIENWLVASYHTSPCYDYAILDPQEDESRVFYINGTNSEVHYNEANVLTDGGTPPEPYGLFIPPASDGQERAVQINCGAGTSGVGLTRFPDEKPHLFYADHGGKKFGGWYACNTTLEYGPAVVLYYRSAKEGTPSGCADVILYSQCAGKVSTAGSDPQKASCIKNVSVVDGIGSSDS